MKKLEILYLCEDLLDFDGTRGDMLYFLSQLEARNIAYTLTKHQTTEKISVSNYDFIYAGVVPQKYEKLYLSALKENISDLNTYIDSGKVMLAIEQSFLFLCKSITEGEYLNFLPYTIVKEANYTIGNILLDVNIVGENGKKFKSKINGFVNSRYHVSIPNKEKFGKIRLGQGYFWESMQEGAVYKGLIGTQLRGPILPRNFDLCNYIIEQITKKELAPIDNLLEKKAKEQLTADCQRFIDSGEQKKEYTYIS
ncbi:glutamine amidotransferase [Erysipelotrichaceae bacterium]|nr:glutamine amidotransferase [Erysipelotrichaceae bacterium]